MRDALLAVVEALGEQRAQVEECGAPAAAQAESAGRHGWDGVALGYETVREHLEGAVAGLGSAEAEVQSAVGLAHLDELTSASDVSAQLALVVDQLAAVEATLGRTAGSVAEAARAAEVVGAEHLREFLRYSATYMHANALDQGYGERFVRELTRTPLPATHQAFRRGFAKALLGQLPLEAYERETGWDFDSDEEFHEHLRALWTKFYGDADPHADTA